MLNRNYRKRNMNELSMVAGGIRVLNETEYSEISDALDKADPTGIVIVGVPCDGKVQVRVK